MHVFQLASKHMIPVQNNDYDLIRSQCPRYQEKAEIYCHIIQTLKVLIFISVNRRQ